MKFFRVVLITISLLYFALIPQEIYARAHFQVAFIRNNSLWIKIDNIEKKISLKEQVTYYSWSYDGVWLAYTTSSKNNRSDLWVYNTANGIKLHIDNHVLKFKWNPLYHQLGYIKENQFNIYNLGQRRRAENIISDVNNFTWKPDGSGIIASSQTHIENDNWSELHLYDVSLKKYGYPQYRTLFTLPKRIKINKQEISSVYIDCFKFSPNGKWLAFIDSPTASLSMDSNILCIIDNNGESFKVIGEMLHNNNWYHWAPSDHLIGYIEGSGRIVFGFENKKLNIEEIPTSRVMTPNAFTELGFTWINNHKIIVSRVKETKWNNDPRKHPHPRLYEIDIHHNKQTTFLTPPKGYGDYNPFYLKSINKITWERSTKIYGERDIWISNPDGTEAIILIKNAKSPIWYDS